MFLLFKDGFRLSAKTIKLRILYKSLISADLGTYGEDVDLLDEVGLVGNHELEKSNQGRPEVSPIVRYPHPATQMEGYFFLKMWIGQ